ncbi:MAG: hypothetical protein ACYS67_15010 [Planctomycetota bacterium]|jgi:hypothetical protein
MEKVCKNCEHFEQKTFESSRYLWGDCTKGAISIWPDGKKQQAAFVWADKNCGDFKPRQERKSSQHSVWAG